MALQRIPKEFVRRFDNELSSEAMITVPDGLVWKMEVKKSANEVWFCNGWQEFVEYYSITFGFFLLFKYEGNSHFSVIIFDMSAAEIYYPCKNNSEKQNPESEFSGKRSIPDHSGYSTRSKIHKLEGQEEIVDVDDVNVPSHDKLGNNVSYNPLDPSRKREKDRSRGARSSKIKNTLKRKQRAIEAAQNFKPANPSFTAIVTQSNMTYCWMDVPASFCRTYLGKIDSMKLQDSNGQQWVINYGKHQNNCSSIRMHKGWIGFAKANNVKVGDVCVFELIKRKNIVFKVTTFAWS